MSCQDENYDMTPSFFFLLELVIQSYFSYDFIISKFLLQTRNLGSAIHNIFSTQQWEEVLIQACSKYACRTLVKLKIKKLSMVSEFKANKLMFHILLLGKISF